MDIKEAIRIVNQAPIWENEEVGKALEVLVEASKKQIAKKPKCSTRRIIVGIDGANCEVCDVVIFTPQKYCYECGTAINWGKEE